MLEEISYFVPVHSFPLDLYQKLLRRCLIGDDCWHWTGQVHKAYGRVYANGSTDKPAHVVMHECLNGPVEQGMVVHHECRVKTCVNPSHLRVLTKADHSRLHIQRDSTTGRIKFDG